VARIESFQTTPNLDTLLKIMQPLGLKLLGRLPEQAFNDISWGKAR
jgi:DNA-binding phage protein